MFQQPLFDGRLDADVERARLMRDAARLTLDESALTGRRAALARMDAGHASAVQAPESERIVRLSAAVDSRRRARGRRPCGSGRLPLVLGYISDGLLDGCSIGDVFQSPSANQMLEVTGAIDAGAGVLYIYGNYGGDVLDFDMATEMASMEDITVETVLGAHGTRRCRDGRRARAYGGTPNDVAARQGRGVPRADDRHRRSRSGGGRPDPAGIRGERAGVRPRARR
ncbi:MAG TPA: dihydroxyacetone kinase subunit DhaK [Vicinamibacterales bacterium]|nr:dihydroxyacetone kinase subunit DhaK [Vicinamibacterales bacterium]